MNNETDINTDINAFFYFFGAKCEVFIRGEKIRLGQN